GPLAGGRAHPDLALHAHPGDGAFLVLDDRPVLRPDLEQEPVHEGAWAVLETCHPAAPPTGREVVDQRQVERLGPGPWRELEEVVAVLVPPLVERRRVEDGGVGEVRPGWPVGQALSRRHHLLVMSVHMASAGSFVANRLWRRP